MRKQKKCYKNPMNLQIQSFMWVANFILKSLEKGIIGQTIAFKIIRKGYYWPSIF
jgi:hypothetical protein